MMEYRQLAVEEIDRELFRHFIRRQVVVKCLRRENDVCYFQQQKSGQERTVQENCIFLRIRRWKVRRFTTLWVA